jgi:cytoskeletal protein CcmA (bactofilin family)
MAFFTKAPIPPPPDTTIGTKTTLTGSLSLRASVRVYGAVEGPVSCGSTVAVEPEGRLKGQITCLTLDCGGAASGRAAVAGLASFRPSASWEGELLSETLSIMKGARIAGSLGPISSKP